MIKYVLVFAFLGSSAFADTRNCSVAGHPGEYLQIDADSIVNSISYRISNSGTLIYNYRNGIRGEFVVKSCIRDENILKETYQINAECKGGGYGPYPGPDVYFKGNFDFSSGGVIEYLHADGSAAKVRFYDCVPTTAHIP